MTTRALRRHPRAPLQLKWSRLLFGVWLACAFAQRGIGAPTQLYPLTVLSDNPNAYWRLDETSGFVAHDRVVGHDCSLTNVQLNAVGYSAADADTAAMFGLLASTNSYAGELDLSSNGIPNIDFAQPAGNSVESWVKGNPQVNNAGIITKGHGNGGEQFSLDTGSDTVANHGFRFVIQDAGAVNRDAASAVKLAVKLNNRSRSLVFSWIYSSLMPESSVEIIRGAGRLQAAGGRAPSG